MIPEPSAKDIRLQPISSADARKIISTYHYSHKNVQNSQIHFGVFLGDKCGGAMSFGPPMDKRKSLCLVPGTAWEGILELNRMAFADWMPRNSESRALSVSLKLIRKNYPKVEVILSFSDAAQCGDGTIYRAAGFCLTGIKKNSQILVSPLGKVMARAPLTNTATRSGVREEAITETLRFNPAAADSLRNNGASTSLPYLAAGWKSMPGHQIRYMYFLTQEAKERLVVPILPYSEIYARGAGMYKGQATVAPQVTAPKRITRKR